MAEQLAVAAPAAVDASLVATAKRASGASAIYLSDPLQQIVRDLGALSAHAFLTFGTNAELYGRVLCGLEPEAPSYEHRPNRPL
jgi:hypothetical protein